MNKGITPVRKALSLLAAILCLLLIAGCGSDNIDPTTPPTSEATQSSTEDTTIVTDPQETPTQETAAPTTPPEIKPVLVDVYADENCLIQFYTVEKDSKYCVAKFRVTNYTSRTLTFQSGCISFNGESTNNITLSDEIAPNSAGTIEMKLRDLDMEYFDIQNIQKISGDFRIIDFNDDNFYDGNQSYRIKYIDVEVPCKNATGLSVDEGTLLYDDENVTISFLHTQQSEEYTHAYFRVKNKTTEIVTIQCKGLALNGESATNVVCSENIAPLSTGNIELKCTIDTTFVDLSNITTLSGTLRVIAFDNDNFHDGNQSYSATFQFPESEPMQPNISNNDFTASVADWVTRYNEKCGDAWGADPIDSQTIPSYIDESDIFRYPITDWITLIIYPAEDATIEKVSLRFDPAGQKGAWIMRVFSLNELVLEVTYPNIDSDQANAVTAYYEDTLYSGSWNWPEQGTKGKYTKDGLDCDLYRAIDSLIFVVIP